MANGKTFYFCNVRDCTSKYTATRKDEILFHMLKEHVIIDK